MNIEKYNQDKKSLTEKKYLDVLLHLYKRGRIPSMISVTRQFGIGTHLAAILTKENLIVRHGIQEWEWIGNRPTPEMAKKVLILINKKNRSYDVGRERNKAGGNPKGALTLNGLAAERSRLVARIKTIDELFRLFKSLKTT